MIDVTFFFGFCDAVNDNNSCLQFSKLTFSS